MILLRIAIGWHLYYEGQTKIASKGTGDEFSSEGYLRNATGPLAETFRRIVPDPDGREALDLQLVEASWNREMKEIAAFFGFSDAQLRQADEILSDQLEDLRAYFADPEFQDKRDDYIEQLSEVATGSENPSQLAFERDRLSEKRWELDGTRRDLTGPILDWTEELRNSLIALTESDQTKTSGTYRPAWTELDRVDAITMWGLAICGFCLMAGFLTPLAALGGAGFLFLFYISMPPWPGLPPAPNAEGTYLFVNKNLIELFALLVLAATPSGLWFGVDAALFGWIDRRGQTRRRSRRSSSRSAERTQTPSKPTV